MISAARSRTLAAAPHRFAAGVLAAVALDVALDPAHTHVPLCPFHAITGWWCPFCGSLRAADELVRGHPGSALRDNALLVLALPVVLGLWWRWVLRSPSASQQPRRRRGVTAAVIVGLIAFTVVRNLPSATTLRPGS